MKGFPGLAMQNLPDDENIAKFFHIEPEILPFLSELLADIRILGSWPEEIIEMLRPLELPPQSTKVLDLGCGKGAVTIPIAKEMRFSVQGVDLFEPFIEEARERAKALGVENLCHYEVGEIQNVLKEGRSYDIVIFAAVGDVLGDFTQCVGQLRSACRRGGYMVIDDGFLARSHKLDRDGYHYYRSHEETIRQLLRHGDTLVREKIIPLSKLKAYNKNNTELIRRRAIELAKAHPHITASLEKYVQWEETECHVLETQTIQSIWLLQRN
jgi:ubiquinone/menaquinone biosynthesis C-methylase UbiE